MTGLEVNPNYPNRAARRKLKWTERRVRKLIKKTGGPDADNFYLNDYSLGQKSYSCLANLSKDEELARWFCQRKDRLEGLPRRWEVERARRRGDSST